MIRDLFWVLLGQANPLDRYQPPSSKLEERTTDILIQAWPVMVLSPTISLHISQAAEIFSGNWTCVLDLVVNKVAFQPESTSVLGRNTPPDSGHPSSSSTSSYPPNEHCTNFVGVNGPRYYDPSASSQRQIDFTPISPRKEPLRYRRHGVVATVCL